MSPIVKLRQTGIPDSHAWAPVNIRNLEKTEQFDESKWLHYPESLTRTVRMVFKTKTINHIYLFAKDMWLWRGIVRAMWGTRHWLRRNIWNIWWSKLQTLVQPPHATSLLKSSMFNGRTLWGVKVCRNLQIATLTCKLPPCRSPPLMQYVCTERQHGQVSGHGLEKK